MYDSRACALESIIPTSSLILPILPGIPRPIPLRERLLEKSPLRPHIQQLQQELLKIIIIEPKIKVLFRVLFEVVSEEIVEVVGGDGVGGVEEAREFGVGLDVVFLVFAEEADGEVLDWLEGWRRLVVREGWGKGGLEGWLVGVRGGVRVGLVVELVGVGVVVGVVHGVGGRGRIGVGVQVRVDVGIVHEKIL